MARLRRGRSKRLVLDIGSSAVRVCELSPTKEGYQLTRYYQREFNIDPSTEEEEKLERKEEVLQELLKEAKIRSKKTITAVPGQSVFTRNRPLPPVPEYKVTQIVKYEIQQQIPFSLDQIALDYQVLDRTEAGGYDVMMAAIKVDVVEKQLEILRRVKRSIDSVDVAPIAAYNWLRHTGEFGEDGQCVALLDLGATTTDIVIQKDNQFKFTRSLHIGGNDVTAAIGSSFNMTYEEAERLKRERGFAPTGDPKRDGRGGEVIGRVLSRLVGEVNRSFAYFRSQPGGGPINRVIVTGGGACLRNIIPFLQRQLGIEVRIAQPLAGIAVMPKANEASEHPEQACVALGLALRCCESVPIEINLIPPRVLEIARRKDQVFYWFLSLATMYLILASIIPVTATKDEQVKERIDQLKRVLAQYDAALIDDPRQRSAFEDEFEMVNSDIAGYQRDVRRLDRLKENRNFWLQYVRAITEARPLSRKKLAISSLESVVIGGPKNTGQAARNAAMAASGEGDDAEGETKSGNGAPGAKPAGGGGLASAFGGGGGLAGLAGGGLAGGLGGGGGRGRKIAGDLNIQGFRGIDPGPVIEPNGFTLYGYAEDVATIREYVDFLKEDPAFIEGGVYWDIKFSDPEDCNSLDNANLSGALGSSGVSRSGGAASGLAAGLGALGGGSRSSTRTYSGGSDPGCKVYKFHIDVQFLGTPQKQPK